MSKKPSGRKPEDDLQEEKGERKARKSGWKVPTSQKRRKRMVGR